MSLSTKFRNGALTLGALGAVAVGSSAIADAASSSSSSSSTPSTSTAAPTPSATRPDPTKPGGHVGANGKTEQALSATSPPRSRPPRRPRSPGTVLRVETDVDHGSPYEAHVKKADGTEVEVLVNSSFTVTAVNTMGHP